MPDAKSKSDQAKEGRTPKERPLRIYWPITCGMHYSSNVRSISLHHQERFTERNRLSQARIEVETDAGTDLILGKNSEVLHSFFNELLDAVENRRRVSAPKGVAMMNLTHPHGWQGSLADNLDRLPKPVAMSDEALVDEWDNLLRKLTTPQGRPRNEVDVRLEILTGHMLRNDLLLDRSGGAGMDVTESDRMQQVRKRMKTQEGQLRSVLRRQLAVFPEGPWWGDYDVGLESPTERVSIARRLLEEFAYGDGREADKWANALADLNAGEAYHVLIEDSPRNSGDQESGESTVPMVVGGFRGFYGAIVKALAENEAYTMCGKMFKKHSVSAVLLATRSDKKRQQLEAAINGTGVGEKSVDERMAFIDACFRQYLDDLAGEIDDE